MPPSPHALVIGIDGGTFDVIDPLAARGLLPNIDRLLRSSASSRTSCTWPAHTAPGWSTFVTAGHPGNHGIYQFYDTQEPAYGARLTRAGDLGRSSAWDWLVAQEYTLGLINIPMSHPPADLPGYQISWPLERTLRHCRPDSLLRELAAAKAHFQSDLATMFRGDMGYLEQAERNVEARVRSVRHLMRTRPTDVVMVVLTEADRVGHHYWHYEDTTHPRHEKAPAGSGWDRANTRAYQAIDTAVGELLSLVDEDTVVTLVSDHGLGQGTHALAVHQLLEEAGLLATEPGDQPADGQASWFADGGRRVDFPRTAVYMPVPGSYGLNLNLRARQARGKVAPQDRDRVTAEVVDLLGGLKGPSGDPVFQAVLPSAEAYPGPQRGRAPDLLMVPADESVLPVTDLTGDLWSPSAQTGLHRHQGIWAQRSPRVRPGRAQGTVPLVDTLPTLLMDLGAAWPSDIDGSPRTEIFTEDLPVPATDPRVTARTDAAPTAEPAGDTADEDDYTISRLREMGYL
ncbi:alkaline phosphatase family protein [Streptomyces sp. H27-C3]|uniref:alkaline phosphatase family protein n=1 Tax=Streptomyces sp. H27-C3 TaxID=3046305 RepID=UPI0024BB80FD|nr:alkaline phosphatase family protein [Streptomyces sp. H27-C3]MDJ0462511.1 alkaline phosphatase family protein [Streptomyces sp. H27-C3]